MYYYLVSLSKKQLLSYHSETKLEVGDLVLASIRTKQDVGLIISEVPKPKFKTKALEQVLYKNFVSSKQIQFAKLIANFYMCKAEICYNLLLPPKLLTKGSLKILDSTEPTPSTTLEVDLKHTLSPKQSEVFTNIATSQENFHLIHGVTGSGKTEIYCHLIAKALQKNQQILFLVPEINLTPQLFKYLNSVFKDQVVTYNSKLNKTERLKAHLDALHQNKQIFLGSRSASFLPFKNLGLIIMDEEHDQAYKQDTNPRYHTRAITQFLHSIHKCKVIYGSATPSMEIYKAAKSDQKLCYYRLSEKVNNSKEPEITLVCLRNHIKANPEHLFTETLLHKLEKNLSQQKQSLLLYTKKGFARNLHCVDCGENLNCQSCDIALVEHKFKDKTQLKCHLCGLIYNHTPCCHTCQGNNFRSFVQGIEQVHDRLVEFFPNAKILQIDSDKMTGKNSHQEVYQAILNKEYDIILGTQIIAQGLDFPDINLVGILNADQSLHFPDFRALERSIALFKQIIGRTNRTHENGEVVIQSWQIDNPIFQYLHKQNSSVFYEQELKWRAKLKYPPFVRQTRLLHSHAEKHKLLSEVKKIELQLRKHKINFVSSANLIEKMHNKFHHNIVIDSNQPQNIINQLTLNQNWKIDRDPQSFY